MNPRRRRQIRRLRWAALLTPPIAIASLYLVGLTLSPNYRTHRWLDVAQSPETLWGVLTDLDGMPTWRRDLGALERLPGRGAVVRWLEVRSGSRITMERVEAVAPERMVIQAVGQGVRALRWTYEIRRTARGTRFDVTEERLLGSPVWRPFAYLNGGSVGRIGSLCHDLKRRLSLARPQMVNVQGRGNGFGNREQ